MNELLILAALIILAPGCFCAGLLVGAQRELYWRIKWIELEHDTARQLGREPRNIRVVEPDDHFHLSQYYRKNTP